MASSQRICMSMNAATSPAVSVSPMALPMPRWSNSAWAYRDRRVITYDPGRTCTCRAPTQQATGGEDVACQARAALVVPPADVEIENRRVRLGAG